MDIGLHASFGYTLPFAERMQRLSDAGFRSTALWWEERRPEIRAIRDQAPAMVRAAGLRLDNLHVPYFACNALWKSDRATREDAVRLHASWIEDCRRHDVPCMVMHVTLGKEPPPPSLAGIDSMQRLIEIAANAGVSLAIENTHSERHVAHLLRAIASDSLGLCFDAAHDFLYSEEPLGLLREFGDRLKVLHVSDVVGGRDAHLLPGDGRMPLDGLAAALEHMDYDGAVILEAVGRPRNEDVESFLTRARAAADTLADALRSQRKTTIQETVHG